MNIIIISNIDPLSFLSNISEFQTRHSDGCSDEIVWHFNKGKYNWKSSQQFQAKFFPLSTCEKIHSSKYFHKNPLKIVFIPKMKFSSGTTRKFEVRSSRFVKKFIPTFYQLGIKNYWDLMRLDFFKCFK